jgi:hypothetical protein
VVNIEAKQAWKDGWTFDVRVTDEDGATVLLLRSVKFLGGKLYGPSYKTPKGNYFVFAELGSYLAKEILAILKGKEKDSALQHQ